MTNTTFQYIITASVLITIALEAYAVIFHQYTISDLILEHIKMRYRVALCFGFCAFVIYHFLFEYPSYK